MKRIAVIHWLHSQSVRRVCGSNKCIMVKYAVYVLAISLCLYLTTAAECPSPRNVLHCTPKCKSDSDCSKTGGKCCLNICNERSCVQRNNMSRWDADKHSLKDKSSAYSPGSATYCGGLKCGPFEKCVTDKYTKRPTCVRS